MNIFNIDNIEGSMHKIRKYDTTERLRRLDHVIVHTGWRPFETGNTEAYGVGYIDEVGNGSYSVEWVDEEGETRQGLAWIPREYLEKTSKPLDRKDVGDVNDLDIIGRESDLTALKEMIKLWKSHERRE